MIYSAGLALRANCVRALISTRRGLRIAINGHDIYCEKVGHGPRAVLCLPGGIGTAQTDFGPQLAENGLDRDKFAVSCASECDLTLLIQLLPSRL